MKTFFKFDSSIFAIIVMGALYILLPSSNNTLDALRYASEMRDGVDLFLPHHLLYNALGYVIVHPLGITKPLLFLCFINAVFAIGCLWIARLILIPFTEEKTRTALIILLGASFGFMRFAIDNEPYIIALFFSLLASWVLLTKKNIVGASLLAATACLFHQIYFFWWLGLLIFIIQAFESARIKSALQYIVPALIVPVCYFLVFTFTHTDVNNVVEFMFHDYIKYDYVSLTFKPVTLLLTPISLARTFFQVHGYIPALLQRFNYLWIGVFLAVSFLIAALFSLKAAIVKKSQEPYEKKFAGTHLYIFILQFLFAFISDGNAKFMVMMPFALCIFLIITYQLKEKLLLYFALGLFFWNLTFGLLPYHFYELTTNPGVSRYVQSHPAGNYLLKDMVWADNLLRYYHPEQTYHLNNSRVLKEATLDSLLSENPVILTDLINNEAFMSRAKIISNVYDTLFEKYKLEQVDSFEYDLGKVRIYSIMK